ncbi:MAG: hypothetical protein PVS2B3_09650 [Steroidobacteraceae bacterium]
MGLMACCTARAADQSRDDAWWTGPLLAPSAATMPAGHVLFEPYLYDVMSTGYLDAHGAHHAVTGEHDLGSLSYLIYSVTDRFALGMIPHLGYNEPAGADNSSRVGAGDLTLQAQYGITSFQDGHLMPAISVVVQETLPTGRYDRLSRPADGLGAGTYSTAIGVYSQDYLWLPNGRIVRARLDLTYQVSAAAGVRDASVYGTFGGFRGRVYPGDTATVDLAAEYSLSRSWVLALDVVYQHADSTRVAGTQPQLPGSGSLTSYQQASGTSASLGFAPAVEYSWSSRAGVIAGLRIIPTGRNVTTSITPAIAINLVY